METSRFSCYASGRRGKRYVYDNDHPSPWGYIANVDYEGRKIWTVDAHREDIRSDSETSPAIGQ
ncbi:MAG TPA: hypothetical protein VGM65_08270 [Candidatus Udaeobacter sp.]